MFFLQELTPSRSAKILDSGKTIYDVTVQSIDRLVNSIFERLPYIVAGILVLLLFWLSAKFLKKIFWTASGKTRLDYRLRILFSRLIVVAIFILGIFTALTIIIPSFGFGDLITGLGFTSFVIGFATKDILNNLLSGVLILWQQPFRIGDYLFIGNNQGRVEKIGVRATHLRKDDGELIIIPNGDMYSSALTIRGAGSERRMVLRISIDYSADVGKTKEIISNALQSNDGIVAEPKPNVVVTDLTGDGVNLSIYFWVNTDTHRPMQVFDEAATDIKKSLGEANIEMFPPSSVIIQTPEKENQSDDSAEEKKRKKDDF